MYQVDKIQRYETPNKVLVRISVYFGNFPCIYKDCTTAQIYRMNIILMNTFKTVFEYM